MRAALTIDGATGVIRTRTPLDHETAVGLEFDVVAEDGGRPSRSSTVRVSVGVLDVDDEPPRFVEPFYAFQIPENQPAASLRRACGDRIRRKTRCQGCNWVGIGQRTSLRGRRLGAWRP